VHPALTFETFVVGDENRLAHDAARRAAEEPGAMSPLLIFGQTGLGKTHLLSAVGHAAHAAGRHVVYATAERFGNDYVRAKDGSGGFEQMRRRYRTADIVLIDDVQFFEGKEKFQEEFFHTFNELQAAGKQIVVTADRVPSQLAGLSDALRSRLGWGLAADLQKPGFATRLAILRAKVRQQAQQLPESVLELIAERCCPTVRELEGYLNRVLAFLPLVGGKATPEAIAQALSPLTPAAPGTAEAAPPEADAIVAAVAQRTGIAAAALRGRSRAREVTYARHLAMYLLREDGHRSVADIGRLFGNRDHSTVLAGAQRIAGELATRAETRADVAAVRGALTAPAELALVG
jgi:chromosomal replication initiator protein